MAARDGVDAVHRAADDLEPPDLQLGEYSHPPGLAVVCPGGSLAARRGVDHRAMADSSAGRGTLPFDDPGRFGELRASQAASRHRGAARIGCRRRWRARVRTGENACRCTDLPLREVAILA